MLTTGKKRKLTFIEWPCDIKKLGKLVMQSRGILRQIPQISWAFRWAEPQWNEITPPLIHPRLVASKATRDCTYLIVFKNKRNVFNQLTIFVSTTYSYGLDHWILGSNMARFAVLNSSQTFINNWLSIRLGSMDPWIQQG